MKIYPLGDFAWLCHKRCGTPDAVLPDIMTTTQGTRETLKGRFLTAIGHICARDESASQAFDRLRVENPDLFPVPRSWQSFWDAITEVAGETTHEIDLRAPELQAHSYVNSAIETLEWADALEERAFRFVEMLTSSAALESL